MAMDEGRNLLVGVSLTQNDESEGIGGISEEEMLAKSMTFQVAMMASDGWVLASDTCAFDPYMARALDDTVMVSIRSPTRKIVHRSELSLTYAFSGGSLARRAGLTLEDGLRNGVVQPPDRAAFLNECLTKTAQQYKDERPGGSLLVIFDSIAMPEIWTVDFGRTAVSRTDLAFGGGGNLAMLFPQRYYVRAPVDRLKFLAAHTILEAHVFNPSVVDGLEVWSGKNGQIEQAPEAEIDGFKKRSAEIHKRIGKLVIA